MILERVDIGQSGHDNIHPTRQFLPFSTRRCMVVMDVWLLYSGQAAQSSAFRRHLLVDNDGSGHRMICGDMEIDENYTKAQE
jgi:hypothetical protein